MLSHSFIHCFYQYCDIHSSNNHKQCNKIKHSTLTIKYSTFNIHATHEITWKPNREKPPMFSSSSMRNIWHLAVCDLQTILRYVYLAQTLSFSHALCFIMVFSTPTDPHTTWINSSTLLSTHLTTN